MAYSFFIESDARVRKGLYRDKTANLNTILEIFALSKKRDLYLLLVEKPAKITNPNLLEIVDMGDSLVSIVDCSLDDAKEIAMNIYNQSKKSVGISKYSYGDNGSLAYINSSLGINMAAKIGLPFYFYDREKENNARKKEISMLWQ